MQKQKNNWKPVKVLAVIFMAGLFLVLLPKFGREVKAATEIITNPTPGSGYVLWSGEMILSSETLTIDNIIRIVGDTTLDVPSGKTLIINNSCFISKSTTLNIIGNGTINFRDIQMDGGTINLLSGTLNGNHINMNNSSSAYTPSSIDNKIVINGGTLNLERVVFNNYNPCTPEIIINSGQLNVIQRDGNFGSYPLQFSVDGSITVNGGAVTIKGGNSTNGNGGSGTWPNNHTCSINVNGGTLTVNGGNGSNGGVGGYGIDNANITLGGGTLTVSGGFSSNGERQMSLNQCSVEIASGKNYSVNGSGNYTGSQLNSAFGADTTNVTLAPLSAYNVEITAGAGMTKTTDSGAASQTGVMGAMTDVVYTADDAYFFPEGYTVSPVTGVSVTRNSYSQITVSGTPTANTSITLGAATMKRQSNVPNTVNATNCTTADNNDGKITGVTTAMEYRKDDATNWTAGTESDITGLVPGTYYVRVKATDSTLASDEVTLLIKGVPTVTAPTAKTLTASGSALELVNAGSTTGGTLKYAVGADATTVPTTGWDIEIPSKTEAGTYYVWYRVEGNQNWSDADSFTPVKVVIKEQASNTTTDSDPTQSNTGTTTDPAPAPVTPVYTPEPVVEKANEVPEPSIFTRKNKDGSETKIEIIWNTDGTTTVINENKQADGTTIVKEETRDAKGNGTLKIEKKDAEGNLLSKTEGTIKVNKKGTETIKSTTENADGSVSEKTQKTYKRDPEADNIKKVTVTEKKTDAAGNTETIKTTAFVGVLGDATITEKSTVTYAGTNGITVVSDGSEENGTEEESKSGTDKGGSKDVKIVVKEERNYSLSVNGRLKLTSLSTDGEKLTIPESIELDGMKRVVKAIGKNAMKGNKTVKEVVLGENITTICTGAFKNCKNLELIELTGSVKKIYKNAFKGIAENAKFVITASEEDFERIVELIKESGVDDSVTFERVNR